MSNFWLWAKCAGVRALKTFAQSLISLIAVGMAITEVDWMYVLSVSAVAAILSILTSVAGLPEVEMTQEIQQKDMLLRSGEDEQQ